MEDAIITQEAEQEIDLKLLVLHVLHRWRSLLAVMLAAAIILAGVSVIKNSRTAANAEDFDRVLADYEREKIVFEYSSTYYTDTIASLTRQLENLNAYQENSILANLDPSGMWVGSLDLYLSEGGSRSDSGSASNDPMDALASVYAAGIGGGSYLQPLADEMGTELRYLRELVFTSVCYTTNAVSVRVAAPDETLANRMLDEIETYAATLHSDVRKSFGNHKITVANRYAGLDSDFNMPVSVGMETDAVKAFSPFLNTEGEKKDLAKQISDAVTALGKLQAPEAPVAVDGSGVGKAAVKAGLIGGVLGFFLLAVCYAAGYVLDQRIHSGEDLKSRFGVRVLGAFPHPFRTKHVTRLDAWLNRLEGNGPADPRKLHDHIAAGIHVLAGDCRKILLTGAVDSPRIAQLRDELAPALPGLELSAGGCMNAEPAVLRGLAGYDAIVLVEGAGETRYSDVAAELSYIRALGLPVLGVVVL